MKLLTVILLLLSINLSAQVGKVGGWNTYTTFSGNMQPGKRYPALIFFPGLGEVGTSVSKLVANGPHRFIIDGGNPLPGWYVISLQPPAAYPNEAAIKQRIDSLVLLYQIDTNRINLTGLSHGGWCSSTYVSGQVNNINSVITVQGVIPDDNQPYPQVFSNFKGASYLCFEQRLDGRGGQTVVNYINSLRPGIAAFIETNFGGGGHCCWANFYGGAGTAPGVFNILGNQRTIYQWLIALNDLGVLALDTLPPIRPQRQKAELYSDANGIYFKTTIATTWKLQNILGQTISEGFCRAGNNTIPIVFIKPGVYIFITELKAFKVLKL